MAKIVDCEDCIYMYHCERTYLGGCDTGVAWDDAYAVCGESESEVKGGGDGDEEGA